MVVYEHLKSSVPQNANKTFKTLPCLCKAKNVISYISIRETTIYIIHNFEWLLESRSFLK